MNNTYFIDIDGTILKHRGNLFDMITQEPEITPNTIETIARLKSRGDTIILTTARPNGCRLITEKQLSSFGIIYDHLIMSIGSGPRIVVNDTKPDGTITALSIPVDRDSGLGKIQ